MIRETIINIGDNEDRENMEDYAYVESIKQISLLHTYYDTNKSQGKLVAVSLNSSSSIHGMLLRLVLH